MSKISLIILDRDGVINHDSDSYIKNADEWIAINGATKTIAELLEKKFNLAIATNQSGIARGYFSKNDLSQMHKKMLTEIRTALKELNLNIPTPISFIATAPALPNDNSVARKPQTAMLRSLACLHNLKYEEIAFIGDSLSDYEAANKLGIKFFLVQTGKGAISLEKLKKASAKNYQVINSICDLPNVLTGLS